MSKTARLAKLAQRSFGFTPIAVILGITILSLGAFFLGKSLSPKLFNKAQIPADWQAQTNQNFGISFMLPEDWDSVEVSDSLVIAPLDTVEDLRENIATGFGFGGGTFLTMQVHILTEDYPPDTFKSDSSQEVTRKESTVGGIAATEYTTTTLISQPGIEQGAIIKTYLLSVNNKKYSFDLLDKNQAETLQKILSSIKFIKPPGSELLGKTKDEIKSIKGQPQDSGQNAKTKKEVWVYLDQKDDSTATYVYFLDDKVSKVEADEYNGTLEAIPWIK